jgi:hypothetical protein
MDAHAVDSAAGDGGFAALFPAVILGILLASSA